MGAAGGFALESASADTGVLSVIVRNKEVIL